MEPDRCPACGRSPALAGRMVSPEGMLSFAPPSQGPWLLRSYDRGVPVDGSFLTCLHCGLVWTTIDPARLRALIRDHGQEVVKDAVAELDLGPYRGLPDTDLAREVADKVAEIDALVRAGKSSAARRYRELSGLVWDEAHKDIARWPRLTRDEKLALFGWTPKKKPPADDLDAPFP